MISRAPAVRYIHELFNPDAYRPGICAARFEREFSYVCAENAAEYERDVARCLRLEYGLTAGLAAARTVSGAMRVFRDLIRFTTDRVRRSRPLLKDPHAIFSAEWLARAFDMAVVVVIRHPAAFVGSIKQAGWRFRFEQLLEQPLLLRHHLASFEREIEALCGDRGDIVDQGVLLWNVIHHVIVKYRRDRPEWTFVRHEDVSRDPLTAFGEIYQALGLDYTESVRATIADYSGPDNPAEQHAGSEVRRDSKANIWTWKTRLTGAEIRRVREQTEPVAAHFYGDEDW